MYNQNSRFSEAEVQRRIERMFGSVEYRRNGGGYTPAHTIPQDALVEHQTQGIHGVCDT